MYIYNVKNSYTKYPSISKIPTLFFLRIEEKLLINQFSTENVLSIKPNPTIKLSKPPTQITFEDFLFR